MIVENNVVTIGRKELAFYLLCTILWSMMLGVLIAL